MEGHDAADQVPAGNYVACTSGWQPASSNSSSSVGKLSISITRSSDLMASRRLPSRVLPARSAIYCCCSRRLDNSGKHAASDWQRRWFIPARCLAQNKMFDGAKTAAECNFLAKVEPAGFIGNCSLSGISPRKTSAISLLAASSYQSAEALRWYVCY